MQCKVVTMLYKMEPPPKLEFDVLVGGQQELPSDIAISKFVSSRCQEVLALSHTIENPNKHGLVSQQLPRKLRRRAASHNPKRIPSRMREAHINQMLKSGLPVKLKRPSRKYRKRQKDLLQEYNRRQKQFMWLETHKWHAKRFHMIKKWGYKIPHFSNEKRGRACYRANATKCFLQDISHYACIELNGEEINLLEGLSKITSQKCGLTFAAKFYLDGTREGKVQVYHPEQYPYKTIGEVTFMWKPIVPTVKERTLWIWVHPAYHQELVDVFVTLFNLSLEESMDVTQTEANTSPVKKGMHFTESDSSLKLKKSVDMIKLEPKNVPFSKTPKYTGLTVNMVLLKDTLCRFRLSGPTSQAILMNALEIANVQDDGYYSNHYKVNGTTDSIKHSDNNGMTDYFGLSNVPAHTSSELKYKVQKNLKWWQAYYSSEEQLKVLNKQRLIWNDLRGVASPAQLPPVSILALTVRDPRMMLPATAKRVENDVDALWPTTSSPPNKFPVAMSSSPIWDSTVRDEVTLTKLSDNEMNELRRKLLVPGSGMELGEEESRIPVMLVHRPGSQDPSNKRLGFGCGWDLIVPAGWGMSFWTSLVLRKPEIGGMRESSCAIFESGHLPIPFCCPDTVAFEKEEIERWRGKEEEHFRRPPDKRSNFIKLGIAAPFYSPWQILISDWVEENQSKPNSFYVLRDRTQLEEIHKLIKTVIKSKGRTCNVPNDIVQDANCLVSVRLGIVGHGLPADNAIICLPNQEDVEKFNNSEVCFEPLHEDTKMTDRKQLQTDHRKLIRKLKRKRTKMRQKILEENPGTSHVRARDNPVIQELNSKQHTTDFKTNLEQLWLPKVTTVRNTCSQEVFGYVNYGAFSFTESSGQCVGFCVLNGLLKLLRTGEWNEKLLVMVRNPTSRKYHFAKLSLVNT